MYAGVAAAPARAAGCDFNLTWTAARHSGGEDPKHHAYVTAEATHYEGHTYWGLNLAWNGFPGNSIACYETKNVKGEIHTGSGPGGISLCSSSSCDLSNRYVRLRLRVVHDSDVAPVGTLRSDLPAHITRQVNTKISGHLRWNHGDPGRRSVSLEWWPATGGGLSHVCHFKPNTTMNTTTGPMPVYLTPENGDFTATLRPGCFPSRGTYLVAVSSLGGFPQARTVKQTVKAVNS
jgi:hypothetical protein